MHPIYFGTSQKPVQISDETKAPVDKERREHCGENARVHAKAREQRRKKQRAESREQRAESREQRAKSREQRAEGREQRVKTE
jgi:hypothetical protein